MSEKKLKVNTAIPQGIADKWNKSINPYKGIIMYNQLDSRIIYARFNNSNFPENVDGTDYIEIKTYRFTNTFKPILDLYCSGGFVINEENNHGRRSIDGFIFEVLNCLAEKFKDSVNIILLDLILPDEYVELD